MIKKILFALLFLVLVVFLMFQFKVLWVLAPYYEVESFVDLEVPIMDMNAYDSIINTHRRPYIYNLKTQEGGEVFVVGINHTKDVANPQLDSLRKTWEQANPDVALVEGRVGNLITWFQDPIKELGEGGLVTYLANKNKVDLYSWEPPREKEIELLLQDFPADQLAMFYTFRPYFSNMRYGKPSDPEKALQDYLNSRTDYKHLKGIFTSWEQLDQKWQQDFPGIEWRDYPSGRGFPDGYLHDIWNRSNLARDEYMIQIILELVKNEKKVFVTMGASHAPRIEATLTKAIEKI